LAQPRPVASEAGANLSFGLFSDRVLGRAKGLARSRAREKFLVSRFFAVKTRKIYVPDIPK
jgi:hypothetical protein